MRRRTIINTLIVLGLAGTAYMIGRLNRKPIFSMTATFKDKDDFKYAKDEDFFKKLNSEEIQSKLAELEKAEQDNSERVDNYRLAAIRTLMVTDSDADKIIKIAGELGLTEENTFEIIATKISELHKELGL